MAESDLPLTMLVQRLASLSPLDDDDRAALLELNGAVRTLEPATYLIREGEPPRTNAFLLSGFALRQKLTSDGARQIVGLQIPGDPLDFQLLYADAADHNVQTLTRAQVLVVPRPAVQELIETRPAIARAIMISILSDAAIVREWLLNVGRRDSRARLAHLLCEFTARMKAHGMDGPAAYELPMTQEQLGDALGLTAVHVNRTLRSLEAEGVLTRRGRRVEFNDWERIRRIADFSELYLHSGGDHAR